MNASGIIQGPGAQESSPSRHGGTYALLLFLAQQAELNVGRLGRFTFPSGHYLYVGSAMGGLRARLGRHLGGAKIVHWHIDYLAACGEFVEAWWQAGRERLECRWAFLAQAVPGASLPVAGFGSSDCRCVSHLIHFPSRPAAQILVSEGISTLKIAGPARIQ